MYDFIFFDVYFASTWNSQNSFLSVFALQLVNFDNWVFTERWRSRGCPSETSSRILSFALPFMHRSDQSEVQVGSRDRSSIVIMIINSWKSYEFRILFAIPLGSSAFINMDHVFEWEDRYRAYVSDMKYLTSSIRYTIQRITQRVLLLTNHWRRTDMSFRFEY